MKTQGLIRPPLFGSEYSTVFSSNTITTSSSTFETIQTLTVTGLPEGTYLCKFQGIFQKTLAAGKIETRFLLNGGAPTTLGHVPLPDDDYDYICQSEAVFATSGNTTITFQWRKSKGGGNIIVKDRRLDIWRLT